MGHCHPAWVTAGLPARLPASSLAPAPALSPPRTTAIVPRCRPRLVCTGLETHRAPTVPGHGPLRGPAFLVPSLSACPVGPRGPDLSPLTAECFEASLRCHNISRRWLCVSVRQQREAGRCSKQENCGKVTLNSRMLLSQLFVHSK